MFSARHLLRQARQTFGPFKGWTTKKVVLHVVAFIALFGIFWTVSSLGALRTFIPNVFQVTGLPGQSRSYLVLLQNNAELRATGGFISAFAVMDFKNGFPVAIDFQDVYGDIDDHEYISPPYPMDILLEEGSETYAGHSFRDANYNPDFTDTVGEVLKFYHLTNPGKTIHGVFTLNFSVLEEIVGLYEPIKIDRHRLTQVTLFETLENSVSDIDHHNLEALATRKDIIQDFANVVIKKMAFNPFKWRQLSEVITRSLNEKEIMLSFTNSSLARKVDRFGWNGSFPDPDDKHSTDVLAVNISNFGGMKTDRYITRDVHYSIEITDQRDNNGDPIAYADLDVTLRHRGDYNTPLSGEYKGYIRAFVPMGSELVESSTGASRQEFITNYVGWGDTILMQPGDELSYSYRFKLDSQFFTDNEYQLRLIKQPGTSQDYYNVVVKSPVGKNLEGSRFDTRENVAFFQTTLEHDTDLSLKVLPDQQAPRVFWHEMTALNEIEIVFAETLDASTVEDPLNYVITDLDMNVPELTDQISIDFIQSEGGKIKIFTRGMDIQPEEHFLIQIRNIRDRSGNAIQPNPRTVTVVQRLPEE
jgi:hypothetical protein